MGMISKLPVAPCVVYHLANLMILSLLLQLQKRKKGKTVVNSIHLFTLRSQPHTLIQLTHLVTLLRYSNMPGPDPRKTKPSAYTIPKAGSSKPVSTRPPLHASAGASAATASTTDNPRPLTHQEVRRSKLKKPPVVTRTSARLSGTRRSPGPRSTVASLKRPDKYDPKSVTNLKVLGSKPSRLAARDTPPIPSS